ncbi:MAG: C10 family peptidase [Muribaculaceae bacterium]|nr:C10 family peptidase [Muribaculaceae bacterium]
MSKRIALLLLVVAASLSLLEAKQISENQARAIAGQFFNVDMPQKPATLKGRGASAAFYVFNNPEQPGWVIVAGDDRARTILAYSDEDYFDAEDVPECVQDWLNGYVEQIENIGAPKEEVPETTEASVVASGKSKIVPLLFSKWAQGLPFNQQCPSYTNSSGETTYCPSGCVAIAMAQIMYYHQSSFGSKAIPAYTSTKDGLTYERPELPSTTFNYDIMNPWYHNGSNTSASAEEVQKLVKYCGQAVEMKYGKKTSSATSDRNAFVFYFNYDKHSQQIHREDVTAAVWENNIYTELAAGRPVYMRAEKLGGGHAFICDGYDGNGLYHINWGWRGSNNGYFALNALSDGNTGGTGAASGEEGYTIDLQIIIGLEPSNSSQTSTDYNLVSIYSSRKNNILGVSLPNGTTATTATYSRSGASSSFNNVQLIANYWNTSRQTYTYDLGWALYDSNGNLKSTHTVVSGKSLQGGYYTYPTGNISFGNGISSGTYYLKPICRLKNTSSWNLVRGSSVNYVKCDITNTTLTMQVFDQLSVQNLQINSVTFGSVKKVGSPLEMKLGVFNNGLTDYNYIYMWVNNTLVSGTTTDVAIGSSGYVTMYHTPSQAGSNSIKFTADEEGTKELYATNVNVDAATAASFTATNSGSVSGNTITLKSVLKNTGSNTYNDYIVAKMWKHWPTSGTTGYGDNCIAQPLYLNSGGTTTLTFPFTGLENGVTYHFSIYYYSNGEMVKAGSNVKSMTINLYDINEDGDVTASDITELYNYLLNGDIHYKGNCDLNHDGSITAADITTLYDYLLGN